MTGSTAHLMTAPRRHSSHSKMQAHKDLSSSKRSRGAGASNPNGSPRASPALPSDSKNTHQSMGSGAESKGSGAEGPEGVGGSSGSSSAAYDDVMRVGSQPGSPSTKYREPQANLNKVTKPRSRASSAYGSGSDLVGQGRQHGNGGQLSPAPAQTGA